MRRTPRLAALALVVLLPLLAQAQPAANGYREPVAELKAIADAPRQPQVSVSPRGDLLLMMGVPGLPGIDVVAQPELKLAGIRIHPRVFAQSNFTFGDGLWLVDVASGRRIDIDGLPRPLSVAGTAWSPDQKYVAVNQVEPAKGVNALWLVDVGARKARLLTPRGLNGVAGRAYRWMPDSRSLLVTLQPREAGAMPQDDGVPTGPNVQQTGSDGRVVSIRTYQDLLRNDFDARQFEYLLRSQPALVGIDGKVSEIAKPDLYLGLAPSPDGRHLLSQRISRPFSYLVPASRFPRTIEVLDAGGRLLHTVARLPLVEGLPTGNDAVPTGVRAIGWRSDADATLAWAEAQDGGDPAARAEIRDHVLMQAAPFKSPPVLLARLESRYRGATWGRGDLAFVDEYWWKSRQRKQWRVQPDAPQSSPQLVFSGSAEDRYNDPGEEVTRSDERGFPRLLLTPDGGSYYRIGNGASDEGDRPFLDRVLLADGKATRLFRSQAPHYERPVAPLDDAASRILTQREAVDSPPNLFVRDIAGGEPRALTDFAHPTPQLKDVRKELIRYKRDDGVELTANLYLPPGYDPARDGPRPVLMWAYPREFKSAAAASQTIGSPYRFNAISYWGPLPWLARGYVVLDGPTMPIVGEGTAEPNDSYVKQLSASARAAVDEMVRRGVGDRERIAVGGHSYGAFMTANLLAHTQLFKAGIARSGAYNRTLTPFGFQAEERNFWQAADTYAAMSPFNHAAGIKAPLLLIHGEQDNNSGTFPIQSERMFAAIKGLGGNARLVMLPNESHGYRARESILTMLAETDEWLQRHLGGSAAADTPPPR